MGAEILYHDALGPLPKSAGEWLSADYDDAQSVADDDIDVQCPECHIESSLGEARYEMDGARLLYTCPRCGQPLVRVWPTQGKHAYRHFGPQRALVRWSDGEPAFWMNG